MGVGFIMGGLVFWIVGTLVALGFERVSVRSLCGQG